LADKTGVKDLRFFHSLLLSFFLASCGTAAPFPGQKSSQTVETSPFYVVAFEPADGASLPSSVVLTFNKAELNRSLLAVLTYYNLYCGSEAYAASSVDSVTGYASVTINLQAISGLASGTLCTLTVSSSLQDDSGNALAGTRSVVYRVP
jgi:hypothetical protein